MNKDYGDRDRNYHGDGTSPDEDNEVPGTVIVPTEVFIVMCNPPWEEPYHYVPHSAHAGVGALKRAVAEVEELYKRMSPGHRFTINQVNLTLV